MLEWICHVRLENILLSSILQRIPLHTPSLRQYVVYWGWGLYPCEVPWWLFSIGWSENKRCRHGTRLVILTILSKTGLWNLCFPQSLSRMGVLISSRLLLQPGNMGKLPLSWRLGLPHGHLGILMPVAPHQAKNTVTWLSVTIHSDYRKGL